MSINERVESAIRQILTWQPHKLNVDDYLSDDLGFDSIDYFDLAEALEDEFQINIYEEDMDKWESVQNVIDTVKKRHV